ncbi:MAG: hypothetical protein WKG03_18210 [Telluria sp.]
MSKQLSVKFSKRINLVARWHRLTPTTHSTTTMQANMASRSQRAIRMPPVGRGSDKYAESVDFNGRPRNHLTGFDIGAYQH